ncbi:glycosyltransferase [Salinimicrobium soli]|uniref:glycosyltransferase n=1 Tax=Salinimicrobium soli TaxID=1254399 RepID=UPI003AAFECFA
MRFGIDASNIGGGGGVTHLREILINYDHAYFSNRIYKIVIFSSTAVLNELPDSPFFEKVTFPAFNKDLFSRVKFQISGYDKEIETRCDILFSITGDYIGKFKPMIGMSRNMLLYERHIWKDIAQPKEILRFWLNYKKQKICFKNSAGILFISDYAKNYISNKLKLSTKPTAVIHHGLSPKFVGIPEVQKKISEYSFQKPFRFLYVSTIHVYKHQWNVVKAIGELRILGYPVELSLVGGVIFKPAGKKLNKIIASKDPTHTFIHSKGHVDYAEIEKEYCSADGILFASTCENMPNILLESMASGKAIACSDKEPMPEFLKDGGFYFDAKDPNSIIKTLIDFLENPGKRKEFIDKNKLEIEKYSWKKTSKETFSFLLNTYKQHIDVQR